MSDPVPARLLAPQAKACRTRPPTRDGDRDRLAHMLEAAAEIFAVHGRERVNMREFSHVTGISPVTVRRLVYDMANLFSLVMTRYLDHLLAGISQVQGPPAELHARRRAEYLRLTRDTANIPTPIHALWSRHRHGLPPDLLEPLDRHAAFIGQLVGGNAWREILDLLDSPNLDREKIEAMVAAGAAIDEARRNAADADQPPPEPPAQLQPELPLHTPLTGATVLFPNFRPPRAPDPPPAWQPAAVRPYWPLDRPAIRKTG